MEELGVGRPSTYASIMQTIQDRGYVWKKGAALIPTWTAFAVIGLLESYFGRLVDYNFTASVENDLDDIANGERSRIDWLRRFYFGADDVENKERISAQGGLKRLIESRLEEIDARGVNSIPIGADGVVVRVGRYGPYLQRGDDERASIPDDVAPDELTPEKVEEMLSAPSGDIALGTLPDGREITARSGRYGPYVTDGEKSASLFKTMSLETITLEQAEQLLTLPRTLGPARRRGRDGAERPLRPVHQEGFGLALHRVRGAAVHHHVGRGGGDPGPAEATRPARRGRAAVEGTRQGSGVGTSRWSSRTAGSVRT